MSTILKDRPISFRTKFWDKFLQAILLLAATVSVLITIAIVFSVLLEAIRFFKIVPLSDFLLGLKWSPQLAMRADQAGSSGAFGAIPLFVGSLLITTIAMLVAVPVGLFSAIYLAEYAAPKTRDILKPSLEILRDSYGGLWLFCDSFSLPISSLAGGKLGAGCGS